MRRDELLEVGVVVRVVVTADGRGDSSGDGGTIL